MARMPGAKWLGEHGSRSMGRIDIVCVHTIVGYAPAHAAHFSTHADGRIDQSRDTGRRSAANLNGNDRIIAIENEDHGPRFGKWSGSNVPPLTPEQVEANAQILAWAHRVHGVPLQLCPDSRPGSRGLAYHRQGIDGNFEPYKFPGRRPSGEVWTNARGKVCPGDKRIAQLPLILDRAIQIIEGDDMTPEQMRKELAPELAAIRLNEYRIRESFKIVFRALGIADDKLDEILAAEPKPTPEPDPKA